MEDVYRRKPTVGIRIVRKYLEIQGYSVTDVSVSRLKRHKGYDLLAKKGRNYKKIEVKSSAREKGIPDCFETEFDNNKKVRYADLFYIVRLKRGKPYCIDILSKREINKYARGKSPHRWTKHLRLSSKLKTDLYHNRIGKKVNLK